MKSNLRFSLVFFVLLSVACGPDEDPNTNAANNSNNTNNQGEITYDCSPNLTGEVTPAAEIVDATEIAAYRYEVDSDTSDIHVDMLDAQGNGLARYSYEDGDQTWLLSTESERLFAGGPIRSSIETTAGDSIEVVEKTRAGWTPPNPTVTRVVDGTDLADPDYGAKTISFTRSGRTFELRVKITTRSDEVLLEGMYVVAADEAQGAPSVGVEFEEKIDEENGWFMKRFYGLPLQTEDGEPVSAEMVQTFFEEVGYVDFVSSDAFLYLMLSRFDGTWQRAWMSHTLSCVAGEDIGFPEGTVRQSLDPDGCVDFIWNGLGTVAFGAACLGLVTASTVAWPVILGAVASCGAAVAGTWVTAKSLMRCACTNPGSDQLVNCGYSDCQQESCTEACEAVAQETCESATSITGECSPAQLNAYQEAAGFTAELCACTFVIPADATAEEEAACSSGDPHVLTFDSLRYSPHAAGEYVATRSVSDDTLNVQVRQEPWGSELCSGVALNTAAAAQVDGRVVSVYIDREPNLYIDGEPVDFYGDFYSLAEDAYIQRQGNYYRIQSSQGDSILIEPKRTYLNLTVSVPNSRADDVEGLFGTYNDDRSDDLQDRDGNVFELPMSYQQLARDVAAKWQVSADESLFTYTDGDSVDTYIIEGFPGQVSTADTLPEAERSAAEMTCTEAGVTDPGILDACVVDVACTGDADFVDAHVGVEAEEVAVLTNETSGPDVSGLPSGIVAAFSYDVGVDVDDNDALSWQGTNGISAGSSQRVRLVDDAGDGRGAIEIVDGQLISSIDGTLTDATIFVRFYHLDPTSTDIVYRIGDSNGAGSIMSFGRSDEQGRHEDGDVEYLGGSLPGAQWHTSTQRFYGTQQQSGNHHLLRIDGQDVSTDPAPAPYSAQDFFVVGNMFNLSRDRFRGYIRALVIYGRVLDEQEIEEVETWIESR